MNKLQLLLLSVALLGLTPAEAAAAPVPDRCASLGTDGYPASCEPTGREHVWWWADDLCCDATGCAALSGTECPVDTTREYCQYARFDTFGQAVCQFIVPEYCDYNECPSMASIPADAPEFTFAPQEHAICCFAEVGCYSPEGGPCGGFLWWCDDGVSEADGTMTCFDDEMPFPF